VDLKLKIEEKKDKLKEAKNEEQDVQVKMRPELHLDTLRLIKKWYAEGSLIELEVLVKAVELEWPNTPNNFISHTL
jgi:hypothetical protein